MHAAAAEPVIDILAGEADSSPVVVSVPHAGLLVPAEDAPLLALSAEGLLRDADLFVDRLYAFAPTVGVPVVQARVSRYVLDVNRAPDDVDRDVCPEWPTPAKPSARGLIWRLSTDGSPVLKRPMTATEVRGRIARVHAPMHDALAALLAARKQKHGFAVLLDAHSMPSTGRAGHADSGARRADVVPGDLRGTACDVRIMRLVVDHFRAAKLSVRPNDPYMGGYITKRHGRPAHGVHVLQLELNRDLYMDERTHRFDDKKAAPVEGLLRGLIRALMDVRL